MPTWLGERDRLLFTLLYNTGSRVSEIVGVRVGDVVLRDAPCVHLNGKGRKQRSVPLWTTTARAVRAWLHRNGHPAADAPLLPTRTGTTMTRANVAQWLQLAVDAAAARHPELATRAISPHTIRHTTAMHLLQSGVDITVIALWLGHESPSTTHMYVEADLTMKERPCPRGVNTSKLNGYGCRRCCRHEVRRLQDASAPDRFAAMQLAAVRIADGVAV